MPRCSLQVTNDFRSTLEITRKLGLAYGGALWAGAGAFGLLVSSVDFTNWTRHSSPTSAGLWDITYGAGKFIAVGQNTTILVSTNGTNWSSRGPGIATDLYRVAYGSPGFVAVGNGGLALSSPDGNVWNVRPSGTSYPLYGVAYGGGYFVAVGGKSDLNDPTHYNGAISASPDGINWTVRLLDTVTTLNTVTYFRNTFVAAGELGGIVQSDPLLDTAPSFALAPQSQGVLVDSTVNFTATALGSSPFTYGWSKDGVPIAGATNAFLYLASAQPTDAGNYTVAATNAFGFALSPPGRLRVGSAQLGLKLQPHFSLMLTGLVGRSYRIEYSADPAAINWPVLATLTLTNNPATVLDPVGSAVAQRFYRAVLK